MRPEILTLALIVGAFTWAFRFFPTRQDLSSMAKNGWASRFLAATGPAAIATLFTASALPIVSEGMPLPLAVGTAGTLVCFALTRSVVGATIAGAVGYGFGFWLM
jgi:hypothetical protein